jgi:hypothetical protein
MNAESLPAFGFGTQCRTPNDQHERARTRDVEESTKPAARAPVDPFGGVMRVSYMCRNKPAECGPPLPTKLLISKGVLLPWPAARRSPYSPSKEGIVAEAITHLAHRWIDPPAGQVVADRSGCKLQSQASCPSPPSRLVSGMGRLRTRRIPEPLWQLASALLSSRPAPEVARECDLNAELVRRRGDARWPTIWRLDTTALSVSEVALRISEWIDGLRSQQGRCHVKGTP